MSGKKPEWTEEALEKLSNAPVFVRKMVKGKVEKAAAERGIETITGEVMDELKKEMMGG